MAGMVSSLIDILNEQTLRFDELLGLSLEEKDAIIKNDLETLQKLVGLKNIVISQNNKLEKKRTSLVKDIAQVLATSEEGLDIDTLSHMLEGKPEQKELVEAGTKLREVAGRLKEANDMNKELLESALGFVEYSLNALRSIISPEPDMVPTAKSARELGIAAGTVDIRQ